MLLLDNNRMLPARTQPNVYFIFMEWNGIELRESKREIKRESKRLSERETEKEVEVEV